MRRTLCVLVVAVVVAVPVIATSQQSLRGRAFVLQVGNERVALPRPPVRRAARTAPRAAYVRGRAPTARAETLEVMIPVGALVRTMKRFAATTQAPPSTMDLFPSRLPGERFAAARLTKVRLPGMDASSSDVRHVTAYFTASGRGATQPSRGSASRPSAWRASHFGVEMGGDFPRARVAHVEPITVTRPRDGARPTAEVEMKLLLSQDTARAWMEVASAFQSGQPTRAQVDLAYFGSAGRSLLEVQLSEITLLSFSPIGTPAVDDPSYFEATVRFRAASVRFGP